MAPTLLDTNVLSELMRHNPAREVVAFVEGQAEPLVSAAVFHELAFGVETLPVGARRERLASAIGAFRARFRERTIAIDAEIAEISGRLRARETQSGFELKPVDAMIAACAIAAPARLATRNIKHFARLGIPLVNPWQM